MAKRNKNHQLRCPFPGCNNDRPYAVNNGVPTLRATCNSHRALYEKEHGTVNHAIHSRLFEYDTPVPLFEYPEPVHEALRMETYLPDGFEYVGTAILGEDNRWTIEDVNRNVAYDMHRGWAYCITVGPAAIIMRNGETDGYFAQLSADGTKLTSKHRLGTLCKSMNSTELKMRLALAGESLIRIFARRAPMISADVLIGGKQVTVTASASKDIEKKMIRYIEEQTGHKPALNRVCA